MLEEVENFVAEQLLSGVGIDVGNGNPLSVGIPNASGDKAVSVGIRLQERAKGLRDTNDAGSSVFVARGHLSIMLCPRASFRLESCLKHGVELVERGPDGSGDAVPLSGLEGCDDNAQFEFCGLFGMEVSAAVTTQNLELFVDGLDGVGRCQGTSDGVGVFEEGDVVGSFLS